MNRTLTSAFALARWLAPYYNIATPDSNDNDRKRSDTQLVDLSAGDDSTIGATQSTKQNEPSRRTGGRREDTNICNLGEDGRGLGSTIGLGDCSSYHRGQILLTGPPLEVLHIDDADTTTLPQQFPRGIPSTLDTIAKSTTEHILLGRRSSIHTNDMDIFTAYLESAIAKLQFVRYYHSKTYTYPETKRILDNSCVDGTTLIASRATTIPRVTT